MNDGSYQKPDFFTARIVNPLISAATRLGISMRGSHVLAVRGRKSGKWRSTPVNPLTFNGQRYLVAPRGETHWVRNARAAGEAKLRLGRREELVTLAEVPNEEKVPILREYLRYWRAATAKFFGVGDNPSDEELARIAPRHPVFRITESRRVDR